ELFFDERLVVPDQTLKLFDLAETHWPEGGTPYFKQALGAIAKHYEFDKSARWKDLPAFAQQVLLYGSGEDKFGEFG
ncbi:MAG: hypothetical protein F6K31_44140, partial [Symploca sp. SIO2G7]|nr:hypothetical protein [Symploca sp. SIO2G7]